MLKSIGLLFVLICVWVTYAVIGSNPCVRIERAAAPVRVVLTGFQWAVNPWADADQRWMVTRWILAGDGYVQSFISRQFYNMPLHIACGRPAPVKEGDSKKSNQSQVTELSNASR